MCRNLPITDKAYPRYRTVDTACSSSLVALHLAVQSLRAGESRVSIVAGSSIILTPYPFIAESKLSMLSPTGRSRMWDRDADGYARGLVTES